MKYIFASVTINGCHMLKDFGLALSRTDCVQPPAPKAITQDLPGADSVIDLSESLSGQIQYNNREIKMEFGRGLSRSQWPDMHSRIMGLFHGKIVQVIFDDDRNYFYTGRATVSDYTRAQTLGTLIITVDAKPYKYEVYGGLDRWKWNDLNFHTGIIRNYRNLKVNGRLDLKITGRRKTVIPVILSDAAMQVIWQGISYDIAPGNNKLYDIAIPEGKNILTFIGHGTISVDYRGGML